jgi:hypothetical protein
MQTSPAAELWQKRFGIMFLAMAFVVDIVLILINQVASYIGVVILVPFCILIAWNHWNPKSRCSWHFLIGVCAMWVIMFVVPYALNTGIGFIVEHFFGNPTKLGATLVFCVIVSRGFVPMMILQNLCIGLRNSGAGTS